MSILPDQNLLNVAINKWQKSIDLLSELLNVPAVVIMKYDEDYREVFVSSNSNNNPYCQGDREKWHGLYCETVIKLQEKLLISNALQDVNWDKNPDIKLEMISYLGFPLNFPDGTPFGTICILDSKENSYTDTDEGLLLKYREFIEHDLLIIHLLSDSTRHFPEKFKEFLADKLLLQESNKVYRRLFESSNAAILIIDADFKFIDCNEMATRMLDRPRHEILGATPADPSITPKYQASGNLSADEGMNNFTQAMHGTDLHFDWIHLKKDGTEFPVEVSLFGFEASDKQNFFAMWKDMSEVKRKESELKESEERFRTIFSKATDGTILHGIDLKTGITHCNEAAYKMLGYNSKDGIIGKNVLDISPEYQAEGIKSCDIATVHITECLEKGQARFEWIHLRKDGNPIWLDIVLTKINFLDQVYIHSVWRDISEIKKYQNELEKHQQHLEKMVKERTHDLEGALKHLKNTQTQLIQSEKMASLGILTAGIAHEINNPLNFILMSYTALLNKLEEKGMSDKEIFMLLDHLKTGVERTSEIIKGLDEFSRNHERLDETCNFHSIIDDCLLILNNQLKGRIKIIKNFNVEPIKCQGNIGKLHQVFLSTLINAIQSIDLEGTITITTKKSKKYLSVDIEDTGCGISNENLPKVTDPFYTTRDPGKGVGLGLSIAYTIIKEHKGELGISSEVGIGTTVRIKVPYKKDGKTA